MNLSWNDEDITHHFALLPSEIAFLGKNKPHNFLGKALLLKFFQYAARFPEGASELPQAIIENVAQQLNVPPDKIKEYKWQGRRIKGHRAEIRELLGFRRSNMVDQEALRTWLMAKALPHEYRLAYLTDLAYRHLRQLHLEPPTKARMNRLVTSALYQYEQGFFDKTNARLSDEVKKALQQLVYQKEDLAQETDLEAKPEEDPSIRYPINDLKSGPGEAKVKNIRKVANRLKLLQKINLPADIFSDIPLNFLRQYQRQAAVESISHLQRRENEAQTYTLLAVFCWVRQREITDQLVELFIQILNDIRLKAKQRVERQLLAEFIRVGGKQQLLYRLAEVMWDNPDGIIREILYPIIGKERLHSLVQEAKHQGTYQQSVQTRISGSYTHHYRQMLPPLLEVLTFRSNNNQYQPLIKALEIVSGHLQDEDAFYPLGETIPLDDVIQKQWHNWVYQQDSRGRQRIRRVRYELCVLQSLRDKVRCKEIWVEGADRYRNPDEDTPADFKEKREEFFEALKLPLDAAQFIKQVKSLLEESLKKLNDNIPTNKAVEIMSKSGGWIQLSPLEAQSEPTNLRSLKQAIRQQWWIVSLLDILKEVDFRVGFTDCFHSLTGQERLPRAEIQKRLLLSLFGLGTNAGLTSVSMGNHGLNVTDLQYIRRRFITKDSIRHAIGQVVNATLAVRNPEIWGEVTTWCASDSKQFAAWNQNLLTQWHQRYRKSGVMVYWHVAKQALCIHSQLKTPSSSEVAFMIEGVVRHCTAMQVDRNYVDTHGQSEVAFAFCHLLGFQLMPRFKNLHAQKLHLPDKQSTDKYPNLKHILSEAINWELAEQQYEEMVKYVTAIRIGTADAETILKRFSRNNYQHPVYKAFSELGKALKTIFLCSYLSSEEVRREIQEGLNVVENWNSANGFILYGKQGEISSNDLDAQEVTILCMHLLQACLVYVNTLMVQEKLAEPTWRKRMTTEDWRGLTPLFYGHVNPYGSFDLDMHARIPLSTPVAATG